MRRNSLTSDFMNTFFDKKLDVHAQLFNLMAFVGIVGGVFAAVISVFIKENIYVTAINFINSVVSFILMQIANRRKNYRLCSCVFVLLVFFIAFPLLFFYCGGYRTGAGYLFLIAILSTSVLLRKLERRIALALLIILYAICFFAAYNRPYYLPAVPSDYNYLLESVLNFSMAAVLCTIVVNVRTRIFHNHQEEIHELNRELRAGNETLARYDRMKSDFLATVAHEINTPLAIIAASSNDTLDLLDEPSPNLQEIRENQVVIERRVKLIDSILLDLMDTVSIENGRLTLHRQPMQIADLIDGICSIQHKLLDENNNELTFDLQPNLPEIWIDPARLEQVFINLLSNAFRHTNGGLITVTLKRNENRQTVSVADNGDGMDAEMARIALRQYVSTTADHWRHGIGLYICRRIVIAHGGEIWIDSEKGKGTTISFSLMEETGYVWS